MARKTRTYSSPLREQQALQTRRRILDAATRVLSEGAAGMTIPAVAKEAGVAVPTVYRHYGSKEELEDGVAEHVRDLAGVRSPTPGDLEGLIAQAERTWAQMATLPDAVQSVLMANIGRELAGPPQAERIDRVRQAVSEVQPQVSAQDFDNFATVMAAIASSPGAVSFRRLGIPLPDAARLYRWLARTLVLGMKARAAGADNG